MRRTLLIGIAILMVSCGKGDWRDATAPATERAKALLKHFRTITAVSNASVEELGAVSGMTKKAAQAVWDHFHT